MYRTIVHILLVTVATGLTTLTGGFLFAIDDKAVPALPESWSKQIEWRSIGPANMMGRITALAVYEQDTNIWWAATASGGLLKTTNNGITFEHQFDDQATVSIGDVQVSQTDPNVVWVGTGEGNPRNSVSWGDGVYKSLDGGETWKNMGLKKTFQTGRIAIHPDDHNIVYVGSLGRLWGPNKERGLFKTTDGGKTWEKIFYVDDKTGVIDVKMNPRNPDELLIATYERQRDGFDGNDPIKKYGDGSAIYKTVDGGKSFSRISKGLPSCKLGRIGLCYYLKNPNYVAAIVESEKIAKEPDDAPYAGLRGEDAEVGAKITRIVDDGPSAKAGLKDGDIVISVEGEIVHSYSTFLGEIRKHRAGDTIKLVVSRDRKPVDIAIELGKAPERRRRANSNNDRRGPRRTPFTGTLGGQAANLQGQQGENEHEYGGVYLSKDGGDSWERINTLNPRPMYYSQIRFDPNDRKNMYVLGTSLYRSKDGGETFTGDGGRGVHVDHHALWIDPDDPRHMILGNDGGIYVTYDRMDNWDHHNHVAIGQFYHVGIGPRIDYRVYGGLQDNGSWGGPVRASNDSGTINTDWFRVGGGDGFITLVNPDDADEVYFESQNGAMGRINLRTGDRGFIRPRPPRGTRYRFNWKTPFILSPHNPRIHYSAGNHVFRSYNRGSGIESISDDITNTDKGSGSAITESPVKAGVIYVGTTDGAVWMTKDSGKSWYACYSKPEKKDKDKEQDSPSDKTIGKEETKDKPDTSSETESKTESDSDKSEMTKDNPTRLDGIWNGRMISDRFPQGQAPVITFSLKTDAEGKVTGEIETRRGTQEITAGQFDEKTGDLTISIESERGTREFTANVVGKKMTGDMVAGNGRFQVEFEAEKQEDPGGDSVIDKTHLLTLVNLPHLLIVPYPTDDPLTGTWKGVVRDEQLPDGEIGFTLELTVDAENRITGNIESPQGEFEIEEGEFEPEKKKLYFNCENDNVFLDFEGKLDEDTITGDVAINDSMTVEFEATRVASKKQPKPSKPKTPVSQESKQNDDDDAERENRRIRQRGFLGVGLDQELRIRQVVDGSGAAKAGLQVGDIVKSIGKEEVSSNEEFLTQLRKLSAGDQIELGIERDGNQQTIAVTLGGSRPRGGRTRPTEPVMPSNQGETPEEETTASELPADKPSAQTESQSTDASSDDNDVVSGTWQGTIDSRQGESDLKLVLKQKSATEITGTYTTSRSEGDITEGTFDAEDRSLILVAENDRFTLEFNGKVDGDSYTGEIVFNGGTFTMDFEVKRIGEVEATPDDKSDGETASQVSGSALDELMPGPRWVSSLHASKFKAERCYITLDGHRSNDDKPYLFVSEDYGRTWNSLQGNLPETAGSTRVLREDLKNENVLYLGCEFGAWVSIDRGTTWTKFANMPTVSVHEFAQHPSLDDVVAATHGRSLWLADVSTLRQLEPDSPTQSDKLYQPRDVIVWKSTARRGSSGTRKFVADNPDIEAKIQYSLSSNARNLAIEIRNLKGEVVKRFADASRSKGLHTLRWDLRRESAAGSRSRFGRRISEGQYLVNMYLNGRLNQVTLTVKGDPNFDAGGLAEESELEWWLEFGGKE